MPWYLWLSLSIAAGLIVNLLARLFSRRKVRLEYEISKPSKFTATDGIELIQSIVITNRGNEPASNLLFRVESLPDKHDYEFNVLTNEIDYNVEQKEKALILKQSRLLNRDKVELSFKFKRIQFDLKGTEIDVRSDQVKGVVATETMQPYEWISILSIIAGIVVSILSIYLGFRSLNSSQIRFKDVGTLDTISQGTLQKLETVGDYSKIRDLLKKMSEKVRVELSWQQSTPHSSDTAILLLKVQNGEYYKIDDVELYLKTPGFQLVNYHGENKLKSLNLLVYKSIPSGMWINDTFKLLAEQSKAGDIYNASVDFYYNVFGISRVAKSESFIKLR